MWRWAKSRLENVFDLAETRRRYEELIVRMASPEGGDLVHLQKWFRLAKLYLEYFARGGRDLLTEYEMNSFDLSTLPEFLVPHAIRNFEHEAEEAHSINWLLLQGKRLPENPAPWSARWPAEAK